MLRMIAASAASLTVIASKCGQNGASTRAQSGQWVLTFEDDFEGDALNTTNWTPSNYSSIISEYDGHDALFIADRVAVANGSLVITTKYEPQSFNGVSYNMTSGWVDSQNKRWQNLTSSTRWEASMRMPTPDAYGAWPAWWLLPEGLCWPIGGEIDIVEWYAGLGHFQHSAPGNPAAMSSTYHFGYGCSDDKSSYDRDSRWYPNTTDFTAPIIDFSAGFHTFGVELNDTAIRFYVDNVTSFTRTLPQLCVSDPGFAFGDTPYAPFANHGYYGILNVAVTQNANTTWWRANPEGVQTLVDWVRWYQYVPDEAHVDASGQAAAQ